MHRGLIPTIALALLIAVSCGKKPAPAPVSSPASSVGQESATPHSPEMLRLIEINALLKDSRSYEASMYLLPTKAGLEVEGAPEGEVERVRAKLAGYGALVDESVILIAAAAAQDHASLPADTESTPSILGTLLVADAARCWDAGDAAGAITRSMAAVRLGRVLLGCGVPNAPSQGALMIQRALLRVQAQCENGLATKVDADRRKEMLAELDRFDKADPVGTLARWKSAAIDTLASARARYVGREAGTLLAQDIDTYGADTDDWSMPGVAPEFAAAFKGAIPVRVGLDKIKKMSASEIARHIDDAESIIEATNQALRLPDPAPKLRELQPRIAQDPTQVARLTLGSPAATYLNLQQQIAQFKSVRECLAAHD